MVFKKSVTYLVSYPLTDKVIYRGTPLLKTQISGGRGGEKRGWAKIFWEIYTPAAFNLNLTLLSAVHLYLFKTSQ